MEERKELISLGVNSPDARGAEIVTEDSNTSAAIELDTANINWESAVDEAVQKLLDDQGQHEPNEPGTSSGRPSTEMGNLSNNTVHTIATNIDDEQHRELMEYAENGAGTRPSSALALPGTPNRPDSGQSAAMLTEDFAATETFEGNGEGTSNIAAMKDDAIFEPMNTGTSSTDVPPTIIKPKNQQQPPARPVSVPTIASRPSFSAASSAPPSISNQHSRSAQAMNAPGEEIVDDDDEDVQEVSEGDGTRSVYGLDPTTKKRFYEPHKRPGCSEVYCLSRVTQIGERICSLENKLIQLGELFEEFVKRRSGAPLSTQTQPEKGQRASLPRNMPMPTIMQPPPNPMQISTIRPHLNLATVPPAPPHPTKPRYTGQPLFSRILAPKQAQDSSAILPSHKLGVNKAGNQPYAAAPTLIASQPSSASSTIPTQTNSAQKSASATISTNDCQQVNIDRVAPPQKSTAINVDQLVPIPIPYKPLQYGLRVYFLYEHKRTLNHCAVCFAHFSDPVGTKHRKDISPIPSTHLERHLAPPLESFLCSICCEGGQSFRIHFLSLPAIIQHLLNHHRLTGNSQIQKSYVKAMNNAKATSALRNFVSEQIKLSAIRTNTTPAPYKPTKSVVIQQKKPPGRPSVQKYRASTRHSVSSLFALEGDCLDRLLECPKPCTLIDRFQRLKDINRTPMNHLIVNISENVISEKDFKLANIVAGIEELDTHIGKDGRSMRTISTSSSTSHQSRTRRSRSRSGMSSIVDAVAAGTEAAIGMDQREFGRKRRRRRSGTESSGISECRDQNDANTDEDGSDNYESGGHEEESDESDYEPVRKAKKKKAKIAISSQSRAAGYNVPTETAAPSTSSPDYQLLPGIPPYHIQYRVVGSAAPSTSAPAQQPQQQFMTPSSALMQQFGYVASKGIYAKKEQESTTRDDHSGTSGEID